MKTGMLRAALVCVCALLSFAAYPQGSAQGRRKTLDSFCGFKPGEAQSKIKAPESRLDDRYVRARKPFRKFHDVRLAFNGDGKLEGVSALARMDGVRKLDFVKKEAETCCRELAAFGVTFEKPQCDERAFAVHGYGPGIKGVDVSAQLMDRYDEKRQKEVACAVCTVDVAWDLNFKPLNVRVANYSAKFGITRKEFIERTFGLKFGEEAAKCLELGEDEKKYDKGLERALGYGSIVSRWMTSPVCGFDRVSVYSKGEDGRIQRIGFENRAQVKDKAAAGARFKNARAALARWLGIASFETKEGDGKPEFADKAGNAVPQWSVTSTFDDDGLRVTIEGFALDESKGQEVKKPGWSSDITVSFDYTGKAERRMKETILPSFSFRPPATIVDAVEFFKRAAVDHDPRRNKLPIEQCGFTFVLKLSTDGCDKDGKRLALIPNITATKISLWDALELVCRLTGYTFEVTDGGSQGGVITVSPAYESRHPVGGIPAAAPR